MRAGIILIVASDLRRCHEHQRTCNGAGYRTRPAYSLRAARRLLRGRRVVLVITDAHLVDGRAWDLVQALGTLQAGGLPVVVLGSVTSLEAAAFAAEPAVQVQEEGDAAALRALLHGVLGPAA